MYNRMLDQIAYRMSDQMSDEMSDLILDLMSKRMQDQTPNRMLDQMSGRMWVLDQMFHRMSYLMHKDGQVTSESIKLVVVDRDARACTNQQG